MQKSTVLIVAGLGVVALVALASEGGSEVHGLGVNPDGPPQQPTAWRRMVSAELIPSEVTLAVQLDKPGQPTEVVHQTAAGWRRWLREGNNVTVWRPAGDPLPSSNGGGLPSQQNVEPVTPLVSG